MIINTDSGLSGHLIEFVATNPTLDSSGLEGLAIVRRESGGLPGRHFSTHFLYVENGKQYALSGHYDLTITEARIDLAERVGRK